jgi:predicted Zn-dependent peptidase
LENNFNNSGYLIIATEVGKEFMQQTIDEIRKEIEILQKDLIGEEELNLVRSYLLGQTLKSADGPYATMDLFLAVEQHGMDLEFYNKYIHKIRTIQAEELRDMAIKHLNWETLTNVTAG